MADDEFDELLARVRARYSELGRAADRKAIRDHLHSLARWHQEPMDYPDVAAHFPETIQIAYATCHPECGVREFIVDGSTQECQRCGSLMFRLDSKQYVRT